jgi:hypothetical protein
VAAGKAKQDPFAKIREKIPALQKYVEGLRNRLSSKTVSPKHKDRAPAYFEWIRLEIRRSESKIADLKLRLPADR